MPIMACVQSKNMKILTLLELACERLSEACFSVQYVYFFLFFAQNVNESNGIWLISVPEYMFDNWGYSYVTTGEKTSTSSTLSTVPKA